METQKSITLNYHANDFYCYNMQGPFKSIYRGERSHFHLYLNEIGIHTLTLDVPTKRVMIIGPDGHLVMRSRYKDKSLVWTAPQIGKYLLKIWTGPIPNHYTLTISGPCIILIKQQIWSPAVSNKDGTLYEKGPEALCVLWINSLCFVDKLFVFCG